MQFTILTGMHVSQAFESYLCLFPQHRYCRHAPIWALYGCQVSELRSFAALILFYLMHQFILQTHMHTHTPSLVSRAPFVSGSVPLQGDRTSLIIQGNFILAFYFLKDLRNIYQYQCYFLRLNTKIANTVLKYVWKPTVVSSLLLKFQVLKGKIHWEKAVIQLQYLPLKQTNKKPNYTKLKVLQHVFILHFNT